jgi:hypothetical protein
MADAKHYVLEGGDLATGRGVIVFGSCEKSPYVGINLWFVYVRTPTQSIVYFVKAKFARQEVFDHFGLDHELWASVADLSLTTSDWNAIEECRWQDMPFSVHHVPNGVPIRFGLSRTQSKAYPDRELWYVVIGLGYEEDVDWRTNEYPVFIVDKVCTTPTFMDRVGSNSERWRTICWESPVGIDPWDATVDSKTPTGYFAPDPYSVFKQDERRECTPWWAKLTKAILKF